MNIVKLSNLREGWVLIPTGSQVSEQTSEGLKISEYYLLQRERHFQFQYKAGYTGILVAEDSFIFNEQRQREKL